MCASSAACAIEKVVAASATGPGRTTDAGVGILHYEIGHVQQVVRCGAAAVVS